MKRTKSQRYYEALYLPPLALAGNKSARQLLGRRKARARQPASARANFAKMSEAARRAAGSRGGLKKWANMEPEERRKQLLANASRMRAALTPESRKLAGEANRAAWARLSPEERAARIAKTAPSLRLAMQARAARRVAKWPFPDGPKVSREESLRRATAAAAAKARLVAFQKRGA